MLSRDPVILIKYIRLKSLYCAVSIKRRYFGALLERAVRDVEISRGLGSDAVPRTVAPERAVSKGYVMRKLEEYNG